MRVSRLAIAKLRRWKTKSEKGGEALVYAMISEVGTVKQPYGTIKPERCRVDYHGDQSLGLDTIQGETKASQ